MLSSSHAHLFFLLSWKSYKFLHCLIQAVCILLFTQKATYIFYYSFMRPSFREYHIDDETEFEVEVIDTWNMTIEKKGIFKGKFRIDLPGREYMAVRVREVK